MKIHFAFDIYLFVGLTWNSRKKYCSAANHMMYWTRTRINKTFANASVFSVVSTKTMEKETVVTTQKLNFALNFFKLDAENVLAKFYVMFSLRMRLSQCVSDLFTKNQKNFHDGKKEWRKKIIPRFGDKITLNLFIVQSLCKWIQTRAHTVDVADRLFSVSLSRFVPSHGPTSFKHVNTQT